MILSLLNAAFSNFGFGSQHKHLMIGAPQHAALINNFRTKQVHTLLSLTSPTFHFNIKMRYSKGAATLLSTVAVVVADSIDSSNELLPGTDTTATTKLKLNIDVIEGPLENAEGGIRGHTRMAQGEVDVDGAALVVAGVRERALEGRGGGRGGGRGRGGRDGTRMAQGQEDTEAAGGRGGFGRGRGRGGRGGGGGGRDGGRGRKSL